MQLLQSTGFYSIRYIPMVNKERTGNQYTIRSYL